MERRIFWYTLGGTAEDAAFAADAMAQLFAQLHAALPGLRLSGAALSGELLESVAENLQGGFIEGAVAAVQATWQSEVRTHVTIYAADPYSPVVCVARKKLAHALWGISYSGVLSLTYVPRNRFAFWHETLHLLGAQDHYEMGSFRTTCGLPTCVMQYGPDDATVGAAPYLCEKTAAIVRRACA